MCACFQRLEVILVLVQVIMGVEAYISPHGSVEYFRDLQMVVDV